MRFDVLTGLSMIVSNEPIALVVSRVSREMMPCSYPVPTLCPCPAYSRRSDRYEGGAMTGEEKERGTTSNAPPFRGVRVKTKRPRGRLLALLVDRYLRGRVYSTGPCKENKHFLSLSIRRIWGEGEGGIERSEKRR